MKLSAAITRRWYLFVIPLFLLLVALPGMQIYPYFQPALSAAQIEVVGQTAVVKFSLADVDRDNFKAALGKMGFSWDGRDIAVSLGAEAAKELSRLTPLSIGILAPSDKEIRLQADFKDLPRAKPELSGAGTEFIPKDALATLRAEGLTRYYELPGREIFEATEEVGTLGVVAASDKIEFIYSAKIVDRTGLEATLAGLKDKEVTLGEGYTEEEGVAAGFTESIFEGIVTYTLSQPGLSWQPTFGIVGDTLLAASSASIWQAAKGVSDSGESISTSTRYGAARAKMPIFSVGSGYIDLEKFSQGLATWIDLLNPLAKVNLGTTDLSRVSFGSLKSATIQWFGLESLGQSSRVLLNLNLDE